MLYLFRYVVESVAEVGVRGWLAEVPGGKLVYEAGERFVGKLKARKKDAEVRAAVAELVAAEFEQARAAAGPVVAEVLAELQIDATPAEAVALELYLSAVPEAARQSLKRVDDPSGLSLPFGYTIQTADDVVKLLPPRPPAFAPGAGLPGRADWVLVRPLGVGGFGEVWLAKNGDFPDLLGAVKLFAGRQVRDLRHEAAVIGRVRAAGRHPGVVPLTDASLSSETPWLMYEYVAGGTLTDWVRRLHHATPAADRPARVVAALAELAGAVGVFHRLTPAVVHRDLKPANVLFDEAAGRFRVTDFGIGAVASRAALEQEARGQTTHGGRLLTYLRGSHTPLYASPQQKQFDPPADPAPTDDVYALGVIGYQMVTGDLSGGPGSDAADDLRDAGAADGLAELLARCVAKRPDRRPKDAAELAEKLNALASGGREPPDTKEQSGGSRPPLAQTPPVHVASPARKGGDEVHFPLPGGLKMTFCWVPPGTCQLGSGQAEQNAVIEAVGSRPDWLAAESQAKRGTFTTTGFWLGKYPVTQAEWHAMTGEKPSHFSDWIGGPSEAFGKDTSLWPVENVSMSMCLAFLSQLDAVGGAEAVFGDPGRFDLPHEDQWEYACRGGLGNGRAFYWGGEIDGTQANMDGSQPFGTKRKGFNRKRPTPVGQFAEKAPHPWGLCDLHGNVWEYCRDDQDATLHLVRGGSWFSLYPGFFCRSAHRGGMELNSRFQDTGLRILRTVDA